MQKPENGDEKEQFYSRVHSLILMPEIIPSSNTRSQPNPVMAMILDLIILIPNILPLIFLIVMWS